MIDDEKLSVFEDSIGELSKQLAEAAIDHEAFEKSLPLCQLNQCRATCCHDGVILSEEEVKILSELGGSEGLVTRENGQLGTKTVAADTGELAEDFPAHFPKTRCVFLDREHRCHWQLKAVTEGKHPWFYKPISCWLHPVLVAKREGRALVTIRTREKDEASFASHTPCGRVTLGAPPARESLAMELKMLSRISGRDFYGELNAPPGFSSRA